MSLAVSLNELRRILGNSSAERVEYPFRRRTLVGLSASSSRLLRATASKSKTDSKWEGSSSESLPHPLLDSNAFCLWVFPDPSEDGTRMAYECRPESD